MQTILQTKGNKYVIEIDKESLTDWKVDPNDVLDVTVVDGVFTAVAVKNAPNADFEKALDETVAEHGATLKRLSE